jgi:hypothetical protein
MPMKKLAAALILLACFYAGRAWRQSPPSVCRGEILDLRVVFGYKDTRPARFVGDRYEANYILMKLEEMGFARDPEDDDLLVMSERRFPPRPEIRLKLVHSSASPDDQANRRNPWQEHLSKAAEEEFVSGLRAASAVFYVGHSRVGGGPDFWPPRLRRDGHVDYDWYKRKKPGMESVLRGLAGETPLKFLGLYSCSSGPHFEKMVAKAAPQVRLETTSEVLYYVDSLRKVLAGLRAAVDSAACTP